MNNTLWPLAFIVDSKIHRQHYTRRRENSPSCLSKPPRLSLRLNAKYPYKRGLDSFGNTVCILWVVVAHWLSQ